MAGEFYCSHPSKYSTLNRFGICIRYKNRNRDLRLFGSHYLCMWWSNWCRGEFHPPGDHGRSAHAKQHHSLQRANIPCWSRSNEDTVPLEWRNWRYEQALLVAASPFLSFFLLSCFREFCFPSFSKRTKKEVDGGPPLGVIGLHIVISWNQADSFLSSGL